MLKLVAELGPGEKWRPVVVGERAGLEAVASLVPGALSRLESVELGDDVDLPEEGIPLVDPVGRERTVEPGRSGPADAEAALAAVDLGLDLVRSGRGDALVTLPVSKASIARSVDGSFRGHTDHLAARCGFERYGRDYLMAFLGGDLQVALLTVHRPLREAIDAVDRKAIVEAVRCLHLHAGGRTAVAGLDPHAGEGGLLGRIDEEEVAPAVAELRGEGIPVSGPESADSVFALARAGKFDWVMALYHDQGLIPVKTAAWGRSTNWTLGLPVTRTSVDHGTAFDIAGTGRADPAPLRAVVATTLSLLDGTLPRRSV